MVISKKQTLSPSLSIINQTTATIVNGISSSSPILALLVVFTKYSSSCSKECWVLGLGLFLLITD